MLARYGLKKILSYLVARNPRYRLQVTFADGSVARLFPDGQDGEPDVHIVFKSAAAERRAFTNFYAGLFEAYIDEEIDLLGERPIVKLADMGHAVLLHGGRRTALNRLLRHNPVVRIRQRLQEARQSNRSLEQAKRNAVHHYGLAPAFFEHLLDDTVGYSEGYWPEGTETLNQAKFNIYDYVARKLHIAPGQRVVEVGSGWGYMPLLMAKAYGADVTVYNPVPSQNTYMRARFARHGMTDRIRLLEKDHRQIREEPGTYDRYVSIGVYEHIGKDGYEEWLESIAVALKPGGIGVISTTGKMVKELTEFLTLKYIFPGGHLPSLPLTLEIMNRLGLTMLDVENLWPHYRRTVGCWLTNLERRWPEIQRIDPQVFNERFRRVWTMYLSVTSETFAAGLNLFHIVFVKGRDPAAYPLTRDFLYPEGRRIPRDDEIEYWR